MKCRLFQIWMEWRLDDDRPLPAPVSRHLARCPRCQTARRQHVQTEAALRRPPASSGSQPSPWLRGRIMDEVREAGRRSAPEWGLRGFATAGVALAAVLLSVAVWLPGEPQMEQQPAPGNIASTPLRVEWLQATARLTDGPSGWLANTNLNDPLHQELRLVMGDARQALRSLQRDFVPGALLAVNDAPR